MIEFWTLAIAAVTALACALSGSFLVLKREALVSEGLAHAVLPGIVIAYALLGDRTSPLLLVGAAAVLLDLSLGSTTVRQTESPTTAQTIFKSSLMQGTPACT